MWVRSEYAGELAVLSAWLAALLPWNVQHLNLGRLGSMLFVRFPFFQVQFVDLRIRVTNAQGFQQAGLKITDGIWVADPWSAAVFYAAGSSAGANRWWLIGSVAVGVAFLFSLAMYFAEDRVMSMRFDPVRIMGGLLGFGGVAMAVSTYKFYAEAVGTPVPVGLVLMLVLAYMLLTVDRAEFADADAEGDAGSGVGDS